MERAGKVPFLQGRPDEDVGPQETRESGKVAGESSGLRALKALEKRPQALNDPSPFFPRFPKTSPHPKLPPPRVGRPGSGERGLEERALGGRLKVKPCFKPGVASPSSPEKKKCGSR